MPTTATFTARNNFSGASFDYENDACKASGEFRFAGSVLNSVNINGSYTKDGRQHAFWANRDMDGGLSLKGPSAEIIVEVATEVVAIMAEIEALNAVNE